MALKLHLKHTIKLIIKKVMSLRRIPIARYNKDMTIMQKAQDEEDRVFKARGIEAEAEL